MRTLALGVDPGGNGALALLLPGEMPKLLAVAPMPTRVQRIGARNANVVDGLDLAKLLWRWEAEHEGAITRCMVEHVHAMPKDKAPQAFAFGRSLGAVSEVIRAQGVDVRSVPVKTWRQVAGVPRAADRKAIKDACRARAAQLWPERADWFKRVKDADAAEAAMIGLSACL